MINTGVMELYSDRLTITSTDLAKQNVFFLSEISGFSVTKKMDYILFHKRWRLLCNKVLIGKNRSRYLMLYRYLMIVTRCD